MDLAKIKRILGQCHDAAQLRELEEYINDRKRILVERASKRRLDEAWARVKHVKPGDVLHAHGPTIRDGFDCHKVLGGKSQMIGRRVIEFYGRQVVVVRARKSRRQLVVRVGEHSFVVTPVSIANLGLRCEPNVQALGDILSGEA